jgi:hypothetical protein
LALFAVVLIVETNVLRDRIARDLEVVAEAGRSARGTPTVTSAPAVRPVLPATAGDITGVDLRAVGTCAPDVTCQVRVLVRVDPRPEPTVVGWRFQLVDRCSGAVREASGGTAHVGPGDEGVAVVDSVRVPPGPAQAVIAVSWSHPMGDQSAPAQTAPGRAAPAPAAAGAPSAAPAVEPIPAPAVQPALAASNPLLVPVKASC